MSHERIGRLLRCRKPLTRPAVRLLCLPYAGGGSTVFHAWSEGLPQDVEVRAAQLPGRQDRLDEAGLTSMSAIVHELSIALDTLPPAPLVLYGHSFGALIAFALAQRMKESHLSPQSLIVGARRAPHLPSRTSDMHRLSDSAFKEALHLRYGTSMAFLQNQDLMKLALPSLRADFTALETYRHTSTEALDIPITVLRARQDVSMSDSEAAAWREQTTRPTVIHELDAGHLFVDTHRPWVLARVADVIRGLRVPKST